MLEEEYVNQLEREFKRYGWETFREVIPDECINWNLPFRVDLIVYKPDVGFIGIEAKSISLNNGGVLAQAHKQIQKYRNKTYFKGKKIYLWALAIKFNHPLSKPYEGSVEVLTREFFCGYGIGYILDKKIPSIDFGYSQGWAKIPFDLSNERMDIQKIIQSQQKKNPDS